MNLGVFLIKIVLWFYVLSLVYLNSVSIRINIAKLVNILTLFWAQVKLFYQINYTGNLYGFSWKIVFMNPNFF